MIESIKKHHLYFIFAALLAFVLFLNYLPPEAISETPEVSDYLKYLVRRYVKHLEEERKKPEEAAKTKKNKD